MRTKTCSFSDDLSPTILSFSPSGFGVFDGGVFVGARWWSCRRGSCDRPGEFGYREIALPDPLAHVSDAVVCGDAPSVFLNMMQWSDTERRGSDYLGLYRVSLPDGALEKHPDPTDPITAPQYVSVTTILGTSSDGAELHVIVTVPIFVSWPPGMGHAMGFFLATYATDTGIVKILDEVPAVFA
jgi:hypothetical protein